MYSKWENGELLVTTDLTKLDVSAIYDYLTRSYWAEGISREIVERSLRHSLCFGLFEANQQIGLARVISDYATFAYLADVYVLEAYRGRGLAKWLMRCVQAHPQLQNLRKFVLVTRDAHELYRRFGFEAPKKPQNYMELPKRDIYKAGVIDGQSPSGAQ